MRRTDGRTDTTKITVTLRNFANLPKNSLSFNSYLTENKMVLHFTHVKKKASFNIRHVVVVVVFSP
jgi:hypothetical protein